MRRRQQLVPPDRAQEQLERVGRNLHRRPVLFDRIAAVADDIALLDERVNPCTHRAAFHQEQSKPSTGKGREP
jgi:hypothetical protein